MMNNKSTQSAVNPSYKTIRIFYFLAYFTKICASLFSYCYTWETLPYWKVQSFYPTPSKMFEMDKPMRASDTIFESFIYNHMNLYKNILKLKYVLIISSFFVNIDVSTILRSTSVSSGWKPSSLWWGFIYIYWRRVKYEPFALLNYLFKRNYKSKRTVH